MCQKVLFETQGQHNGLCTMAKSWSTTNRVKAVKKIIQTNVFSNTFEFFAADY